jgi:uncharacterized membrane protein HdeD (DUF308 family)
MPNQSNTNATASSSSDWLRTYYFTRAAVSIVWVALAFAIGRNNPAIAAILLVAYPAWDALANYLDAQKSGGLGANRSQVLNLAVSVITAIAVAIALTISFNAVFVVFGAWATLSGLFQLFTAVGRWKTNGAQWVQILSGAQSALVGGFFITMALGQAPLEITPIAGYAGLGAFYFLLSAIWLTVKMARQRAAQAN